ncbi:hypothetical protein ACOBQX_02905 [Actinokineospora sp. G85]|uniref:hypothetical protein n=1 Tax=Actinokineospora sp. G85 TaxID=3406626 RepID=UPI003C78779F
MRPHPDRAYDKALSGRTFRVVDNNDIVAQVPPELAFRHVAALRYIDSACRVRESMPVVSNLLDRGKERLLVEFEVRR